MRITKIKEIYKRKDCSSCDYLYSLASWWCGNEDAIEERNTKIPGVYNCPYWKPDKKWIRKELKNNH
jgi:hypothetical protein